MQNDGETVGDLRESVLKSRSDSTSLFALCYWSNGQYNEAEELYKRSFAGYEKKLGLDHPDTLWTVRNFTNFLRDRGRVENADLLLARFGSYEKETTLEEERIDGDSSA